MDLDGLVGLDEGVRALLANTVLPAERHSVTDREGLAEVRSTHTKKKRFHEVERIEAIKACLKFSWISNTKGRCSF